MSRRAIVAAVIALVVSSVLAAQAARARIWVPGRLYSFTIEYAIRGDIHRGFRGPELRTADDGKVERPFSQVDMLVTGLEAARNVPDLDVPSLPPTVLARYLALSNSVREGDYLRHVFFGQGGRREHEFLSQRVDRESGYLLPSVGLAKGTLVMRFDMEYESNRDEIYWCSNPEFQLLPEVLVDEPRR